MAILQCARVNSQLNG